MNDVTMQENMPREEATAGEPNSADVQNQAAQQSVPQGAQQVEQHLQQEQDTEASEDSEQEQTANTAEQSWSSLPPQSEQLIRLAPLPADRATGLRHLLFGSFGRTEKHSSSQSMLKLSLSFPGHASSKGSNYLEVWADHATRQIHILPEHGLITAPGNRGLGRFIMAQAARWVRKNYPNYKMTTIAMRVKHVADDAARLRRDHCLQAQGFAVTYEDAVQMRASCSVKKSSEINTDWNQEKVRIIETSEVADILQKADKTLKEQERELKNLNEKLAYLKKDDNSLRFTITMLVVFAFFQAALLIWMATQ